MTYMEFYIQHKYVMHIMQIKNLLLLCLKETITSLSAYFYCKV